MKVLLLMCAALALFGTLQAKVIYVNDDATGNNSGNNWKNAYKDLQDGLSAAKNGDELWVAEGTYVPGTSASSSFKMKEGVSLYGGFEGTESKREDRDPRVHITVLSGEIGTVDKTDNVNKILLLSTIDNAITISGFTISKGYVSDFVGCVEIASSAVIFSDCIFENNENMGGFASGGAITVSGFDGPSTPQFINCIFRNNKSNVLGGAVHIGSSTDNLCIFTSCLFDGNQAARGGALHNGMGGVRTINCTFVNNTADKGSASYAASNTSTEHTNAIIWDSNNSPVQTIRTSVITTVTYSIVRGGFTGTGNMNSDPRFISSSNYGLSEMSPAIDAGNPAVLAKDLPVQDVSGGNRLTYSKLDLGAYEFQCSVTGSSLSVTTCDAFISNAGNTYISSGTYTEKYATADGCDSVVTLNLTITNATHSITETACEVFEYEGEQYTKTGQYTQVLKTSKGCDSTVMLDLTIVNVNAGISQDGNTLTADAGSASYQWVDCNKGNAPIDGETSRSYTATEDGSYAVEVTENGCTKLSDCFNLTPSNAPQASKPYTSLYPNPAQDLLTVDYAGHQASPFELIDMQGAVALSGWLQPGLNEIHLQEIESGIYVLNTEQGVFGFQKL